MATKIGKAKLVWGLYVVLGVGIFLSAVSVKPARAVDFDSCTFNECNAAFSTAYANCVAQGGRLDSGTFLCPSHQWPNDFEYSYCCVISGTETCTFSGFCD